MNQIYLPGFFLVQICYHASLSAFFYSSLPISPSTHLLLNPLLVLLWLHHRL